MATIVEVEETRWTQPDGGMGFQFRVLYDSGRRKLYTWQEPLPMTVLHFLLVEAELYDTQYVTGKHERPVKIMRYRKENQAGTPAVKEGERI